MDSDDADEENKLENGKTLLYVFERGYASSCDAFSFIRRFLDHIVSNFSNNYAAIL